MAQSKFHSLRIRLLLPLVAVAGLAAITIAAASYALGSTWAFQQVRGRFEAIQQTISAASFPISQPVLESISTLTQTELLAFSENGRIQASTIDVDAASAASATFKKWQTATANRPEFTIVAIEEGQYWGAAFSCRTTAASPESVASMVVLFSQNDINSARIRAAMLPLVTGLSTVVLLSTLTLAMTGRLIKRLVHLEKRVEQVAGGDFGIVVDDASNDEIGRLGNAVNQMTNQLGQLWQAVHRQEREKLLHQLAAGLAHQLRNSLTGARMAMELHAQRCSTRDDEGLQVAMLQLDQVEETVKRLLAVGTDKHDVEQPASVLQCLQNIQLSLSPFARHWQVQTSWELSPELGKAVVQDGPTLTAALTNLTMNAMQAGKNVKINAGLEPPIGDRYARLLRIEVSDNGQGISESIAGDIFEPFVTSKPEGLGLGLSVVRRSAESLGGSATWTRADGWTHFVFLAQVHMGVEH